MWLKCQRDKMQKSLWILWLPTKLDPTPCPLVPPVADVHRRGSWSGQAAPETHRCSRPILPLQERASPARLLAVLLDRSSRRRRPLQRSLLREVSACALSSAVHGGAPGARERPPVVFRDDAAIERALAKSKLVQDIVSGVDSSCWSGRSQRPLFIHFSTSRSQ